MSDQDNPPLRPCGTCFACCIWLGIDAPADWNRPALRKFVGQTCTKLDIFPNPECCCKIYQNRPKACENYNCAWKSGFGTELDRPDKTGMLCTVYRGQFTDFSMTIMVFDGDKSGGFDDRNSPLYRMITEALIQNILDIRIVNPKTRVVIHMLNGTIRRGELIKSAEPEMLEFATFDPPLGTFALKEDENP